jgi:predicted transposase YbfD/YdcC
MMLSTTAMGVRYGAVAGLFLSGLQDGPGVQNVVMVETLRSVQYVAGVTCDLRHYLSSCTDAPEIQIAAVRKHWAIENSLHWVLDVTFREDDSQIREQVSTRMFAQLRKMALNIVKRDKGSKISLRARRKSAGWDNIYMEELLFNCMEINDFITTSFNA